MSVNTLDSQQSAGYEIKGLIRRYNDATTWLGGVSTEIGTNDLPSSGITFTQDEDDTNDSLKINVTNNTGVAIQVFLFIDIAKNEY